MVHGDIDEIIRDIREAHKGDSTSAPERSVAAQLKKALADAENFKGSMQEKQIAALLGQLGIDYNRLSAEEMRILMKAFGKSKHLKSPGSKRGKKRK